MRAYYAIKLSDNISRTPEGFLVCKNASIAGTWPLKYYRHELGLDGDPNEQVIVHRRPEDVFSPETIASFEGKPVTDDHPYNGSVNSENATELVRGYAKDVRAGKDKDNDKLLADLIIYDKHLAEGILDGKRELSGGYDAELVEMDGKFYQRKIRGNHIAVVEAGRAGSEVSIKDHKPEEMPAQNTKTLNFRRRNTKMPKPEKLTLVDRIAKILRNVKDADPEEVAEIVADIVEDEETTDNTAQDNTPLADQGSGGQDSDPVLAAIHALTGTVQGLTDQVAGITSDMAALKDNAQTTDQDTLDSLLDQLDEAQTDEEAQVTEEDYSVAPETIDEEGVTDNEVEDQETADFDPTADQGSGDTEVVIVVDKDSLRRHIRQMKPIVAKMTDKKQKKAITDGMAALVRSGLHKQPAQKDGYRQLLQAQAIARKKLNDSRNKGRHNPEQAAQEAQKAYDSFNPHKAKGV